MDKKLRGKNQIKQRPLSDLAKFAISLDEKTDVIDFKEKSAQGNL